jgi:tetratricopeptide (TPR) repeat protein
MTRAALRLGRALVAATALAACRGEPAREGPPPVTAPALATVPEPDLAAAAPAVREQIGARREALRAGLEAGAPGGALAESFGQLGLVYLVYDFLDAAEACFANSERLAAEDFRWPYLRGYLTATQGRLSEAETHLARALELRADYPPALLRLGRVRLGLGQPEPAGRLFARALELDPAAAVAEEGLAQVAEARGDLAAAAGHYTRALELEPAANRLHYGLAQVYRRLGQRDRARDHLARSGDVPPRLADPLINPLAELGRSAQFYIMQAGEAMEDEDWQAAATAYHHALEQDPENLIAHKGLARSLEKLGDLDGATAQLRSALERAPALEGERERSERAGAHTALAGLLLLRGEDAEAAVEFRRALGLAPRETSVRVRLGAALARQGRFAEAVAEFDRALAEAPEDAAAVLLPRATALMNLGRRQEAIADFRRAVELRPADAQLRLRLAEALEFVGRAGEAAAERDAAARLAGDPAAQARLALDAGARLASQGRHAEALAAYREAAALVPDGREARFGLASVLGHLGRYSEAAQEFALLVERHPEHLAARRGEILALVLAGYYGPARVRLNEAMRLAPLNAELAQVQVRLLSTAPDPAVRDGRLALEIASRLAELRPDAAVREALALAAAEAGDFARAVALQREVVRAAEAAGDTAGAQACRQKLAAFERGNPWHASRPEEILAAAAVPR